VNSLFSLVRLSATLMTTIALAACSPDAPDSLAQGSAAGANADETSSKSAIAVPDSPEVIVFGGLEDTMAWLEAENWWGTEKHDQQLTAPHAIITGISQNWRTGAKDLPVSQKKEIFYRFMLPLVMHANEMVKDRRALLMRGRDRLAAGENLPMADLEWLKAGAVLLRVTTEEDAQALIAESPELAGIIDEMLYRLDEVPAGLALGQAAYESGYGTSRFAAEGNALFGQWTYGGNGMTPEQQRKSKGNYGVAAFDWPFDSVRGYFINLMSHPAYEDFRRLRAEMRAAGQPLSSLALADGLVRYSERGQEYVDGLKGIIRVNKLEIADSAVFRDEPVRFIVGAGTPEAAAETRQRIEQMRKSGEIEGIVARMRLE
jgi:uncharacterized FlgJ-related protein